MQFEGNWAAVADVIVDKVGKYAHVIGSPLDTASTPVVMDVSLDVRTKVRDASWLICDQYWVQCCGDVCSAAWCLMGSCLG